MDDPVESKTFLRPSLMAEQSLRFALVVKFFLERKGLTFADGAKRSGLTHERFKDILSGQHSPNAADALRISYGLEIRFEPTDFEERGLTL